MSQVREIRRREQSIFTTKLMAIIFAMAILGFILARTITGSSLLAIPFIFILGSVPVIRARQKIEKERLELAKLWPELIDHIISGLRSGLSLAETLISLGTRGPKLSEQIFKECEVKLRESGEFSECFAVIKRSFNDSIADQVCEVLDFARGTGSRDTAITLRILGDFIRSDIAVRAEIRAKHGWIKNSAAIAVMAPWILLLILSAQPTTTRAFATSTGIMVLIIGVCMSILAYFWMGRVGRVREIPRVFA